jgi:ribosomal-protein-alanine N-acetyltransferase
MPINIEITNIPNADTLSAIHTACFAHGWSAREFTDMLAVRGTMAFIAEGKTGFALARHVGDDVEIITLGVLQAHRGKGIGKALVMALRQWAAEQRASAVFLEVRASNIAALELYHKIGFGLLSRRKDYYRNVDGSSEDAIVMRYRL